MWNLEKLGDEIMALCITCGNNSDLFFGDMGCHDHNQTIMQDGVKQSRARVCMSESKKVVR